MMAEMEWLIGIVIGLLAGAGVAATFFLSRRGQAQAELANARARAQLLEQQIGQHLAEIERVRNEFNRVDQERETAQRQEAVIKKELESKQELLKAERQLLDDAKAALKDAFRAVGGEALAANNQQFLHLAEQKLAPFKELLGKQEKAVAEIEQKRDKAYGSIEQQITAMAKSNERVATETGKLATALHRSEIRGRWGQKQLRTLIELTGMIEHCDFDEEQTIDSDDGRLRPDLFVHLPGEGIVIVDSKVSLDAYLEATNCEDSENRRHHLKRHAKQIADHVLSLADKRYWDYAAQIGKRTPKMVVMFVSPESALIAAMETDPTLYDSAMSRKVVIATPMLLLALLHTVAYGWQQDAQTHNAQEIAKIGAELYSRFQKFVGDLEKVGRSLSQASNAYNTAIGALEGRVMPGARKLKELHATTDAAIEAPAPIEIKVREIVSSELKPLPQPAADAADG